MALAYNPVPARTQEGLELIQSLKSKLRYLKEDVFGPDSNRFDESKPSNKLPPNVRGLRRFHEFLECQLSGILSSDVIVTLNAEQTLLKRELEEELHRVAMEEILPQWMSPDTPVIYSLRIEGRNRDGMRGRRGLHAGYLKRNTPIQVLTAGELSRHWREILVTDEMLDASLGDYAPRDADYVLSSVHRIQNAVQKNGNSRRRNGNSESELVLGNWRADHELQLHERIKSGPELLWKYIVLLTGLEEKAHAVYRPREDIVDEAGVRLITSGDYVRAFIDIHQHMVNMEYRRRGDLGASISLQQLDPNVDVKTDFLARVPRAVRGLYDRATIEEDRSYITLKDVPPYYFEALLPVGSKKTVFGRNVIDMLVYPLNTFKAMYGSGFDPFVYKERDEAWRHEHYTLMEWLVGLALAPASIDEKGERYVRDLIRMRMEEASLLPRRGFHLPFLR